MKKLVYVFVFLSIFFNVISIANYYFAAENIFDVLSGRATTATLGLVVLSPTQTITIQSPQNTTYNFSIGASYILDLNVSADFNATAWRYKLEDLEHGTVVNASVSFTPNTTIVAKRWSNRITVFANVSSSSEINETVVFSINVPNSAPTLNGVNNQSYICEGQSFSYNFNATDIDEDSLTFGISSGGGVFFVRKTSETIVEGLTTSFGEIYSGLLGKSQIGNYTPTISVRDGGAPEYTDSKQMNISVIEINNAPVLGDIGVQTVWSSGDNNTFEYQAQVSDIENGNQYSGNFSFNLTFINGNKFFDINKTGFMSFTANASVVGVYNITVCVSDRALSNIHPNISICGETGLNKTDCDDFSLTVTDENRAPEITDYYPDSLSFGVGGTNSIYFNVSTDDADGTIPDSYWYVDDVRKAYYSGNASYSFAHSFGCGVSGVHQVKAEVTDGELNDSLTWNVSVSEVVCSVSSSTGGGGGGGGTTSGACVEKLACYSWGLCLSAEGGLINAERDLILSECFLNKWDEQNCGFQTRNCFDVNRCGVNETSIREIQVCYFTLNPSCSDGIKNCHDGDCEFLVDCGGPCGACATCSDGIQNQGEENVDCGGPCPRVCEAELLGTKYPLQLYIVLGAIFFVAVVILIVRYIKYRQLKRL